VADEIKKNKVGIADLRSKNVGTADLQSLREKYSLEEIIQ